MGANTGTYPDQLTNTFALEPGDEVLIRRGNSIIVVDYTQLNGGGGGYVPPVREDVLFYSGEIGNNENYTGMVELSTLYQLFRVTTDVPCRIRLYVSGIQASLDIDRPIGTDPVGNHGLIFEYVTTAELLTADLTPVVYGYSDTSQITYIITNLSGFNDTIDVTLNHIKLGETPGV